MAHVASLIFCTRSDRGGMVSTGIAGRAMIGLYNPIARNGSSENWFRWLGHFRYRNRERDKGIIMLIPHSYSCQSGLFWSGKWCLEPGVRGVSEPAEMES